MADLVCDHVLRDVGKCEWIIFRSLDANEDQTQLPDTPCERDEILLASTTTTLPHSFARRTGGGSGVRPSLAFIAALTFRAYSSTSAASLALRTCPSRNPLPTSLNTRFQ